MAKFNEILAGRLNRALQKFTGIKGGPPTPQLSSEIIPMLPMFWGVENRFLEQWNRFGFITSVAAQAGNTIAVQLRNPVTSGVVVVLERALVVNINAAITEFRLGSPGARVIDYVTLLTPANYGRFDGRLGQTVPQVSSGQIVSISTAGAQIFANPIVDVLLVASSGNFDPIIYENQELTVLPGDAIQWYSAAVNVGMAVSMWWRERPLEDSEKFG